MKRKFLILILIVFFGYFLNGNSAAEHDPTRDSSDEVFIGWNDPLIAEIKTILENYYLEPERLKKIDWNRTDKIGKKECIKEIFSNLDPHSHYLNPEEFKKFLEVTNGKYGGIGIELQFQKKSDKDDGPDKDDNPEKSQAGKCADFLIIITEVFPGKAAEKAGVLPEDVLIKINDKEIGGWCLPEIAKEIKGEIGSDIKIAVLRENKELIFIIKREIIKIDPVEFLMFEDAPSNIKIGYLKIKNFNTKETFHNLTEKIRRLAQKGANDFILDLRGNHGGMLSEAIDVTDIFLNQNFLFPQRRIITSTKDKNGNVKYAPFSFTGDNFISYLIVLVDANSASASEIVASALQDHKVAIIIGVQTFGKASIQTSFPLQDGGAALVTTDRYYRPNGQTLQGYGVIPDIIIPKETNKLKKDEPEKREKDIEKTLKPIGDEPLVPFSDIPKKYQNDFQLMKTLEIIRSFERIKK